MRERETAVQAMERLASAFWGVNPKTGGPGTFQQILDEAVPACSGSADDHCAQKDINGRCRDAFGTTHQRWVGLAHQALLWAAVPTTWAELCVDPLPPETWTSPRAPEVRGPGTCPTDLARISWKTTLGPLEVKVNCEKLSVELAGPVTTLLHAFGEIQYERGSGTLTIAAGSKGKIDRGPFEANFKSGVYLKADRTGSLTDVGWQVGPEVTATHGSGIEVMIYKSEMELPFVSGLSAGLRDGRRSGTALRTPTARTVRTALREPSTTSVPTRTLRPVRALGGPCSREVRRAPIRACRDQSSRYAARGPGGVAPSPRYPDQVSCRCTWRTGTGGKEQCRR